MLASARSKSTKRESDARRQLLSGKWLDLRNTLQRLPRNPAPDAVHDTRVAIRSLRALLRTLRDEVNPPAYAQLRFDLTNLGREFAAIRSADMYGRKLDALLATPAHENSKDYASLQSLLLRRAAAARQSLAQRVLEARWRQRLLRIDATMGDNELLLKPAQPANDEYRAMLVASIEASLRALRKRKTSIARLHKQRIRIKSTRYVCEALARQIDTRRLQKCLRKTQNVLGDIHDYDALLHWIQRASVPTPLGKRLVKKLRRQVAQLIGEFQEIRPALLKCLRSTAVALRNHDLDVAE